MKQFCTLLCLCLTFCHLTASGQVSVPFLQSDLNQVRESAGQQGSLYFAFFTADWCAPCHWMEKQTFTNPQLAQYVRENYLAVRVDIDQHENRVHQERFQVKLLPSILIFNAQGQLLAKVETALSSQDLLEILAEHDLPKNRIGSSRNDSPNEVVMDSPKPYIKIYRPPLPSENSENAPPPPTELPRPVVKNTPPPQTPVRPNPPTTVRQNYRSQRETFAPRSENTFSIQVASYENYQQAIQQVGQLESGFREPVRLMGGKDDKGQPVFRIFIGLFAERQKAEDYLFYLRRKNMSGVVRDMKEVE